MGITHNGHNQLGDSHSDPKPLHGGLSELGRKAVAEMNRLGIMVDVSHSAKTTMMQVLQCSKAPVLASHSAVRAVCDHTRNLDDEQLRALKENGGVIQCVALGAFVKGRRRGGDGADKGEAEPADLEERMAKFRERVKEIDARWPAGSVRDFVDHIDHAVKVAGIDHRNRSASSGPATCCACGATWRRSADGCRHRSSDLADHQFQGGTKSHAARRPQRMRHCRHGFVSPRLQHAPSHLPAASTSAMPTSRY
jgi:membrane dipeptidase